MSKCLFMCAVDDPFNVTIYENWILSTNRKGGFYIPLGEKTIQMYKDNLPTIQYDEHSQPYVSNCSMNVSHGQHYIAKEGKPGSVGSKGCYVLVDTLVTGGDITEKGKIYKGAQHIVALGLFATSKGFMGIGEKDHQMAILKLIYPHRQSFNVLWSNGRKTKFYIDEYNQPHVESA